MSKLLQEFAQELRKPETRFIFQGSSDFATSLADEIEQLRGLLARCPLHIEGNIAEWRKFLEPHYSESAQQFAIRRVAEGDALLKDIKEVLGDERQL